MSLIKTPRVTFTKHASERSQQRGVKGSSVVCAAMYGEPIRAVGGLIRRTVTNKVAKNLIKCGWAPRLVSDAKGTVVITAEGKSGQRCVVTVRPTESTGRRRGGKYKPKHGKPK